MSVTRNANPAPTSQLPDEFRLALRGMASTVSIVTALGADGSRQGATVTSMTSVSLKPPALLVGLNGAARTHAAVLANRLFCVSILGESHRQVAACFADPTQHDRRFTFGAWRSGDHGLPMLEGAIASIFCVAADCRPFGTHTIIIGEVERVLLGPKQPPLLYHDGRYRALGGLIMNSRSEVDGEDQSSLA